MEDRKKIEAVLFAVGDKIEEAELSRLTKLPLETVKAELHKLKEDYSLAKSTFIVLNEGTKWKLTVGEDYMPIVQKIVPKTELSRPVLETLAVIAWKSPVLQSNIINIRSSKAYDHIAELEQVGFITKQKYGRSFMLRLSQQFFEYFDIKGKEGIKDVFKDIKISGEPAASPDKKLQEFGGAEEATQKTE
jgi:segregation and condensation protein B